ncbi:hypothetical protein M3Y99_01241300 [Aphelenchoides fujianensis]|nr:hypothetical protein M3Y99_01241300 [Aphelenchoides fujianensis]
MADDEEQAGAFDHSADEDEDDEDASDQADSPVEYKLPIHNKRENWTKFFCKRSSIVCCSRDGRYAYCLCKKFSELLIVDFVRQAQLFLKPKQSSFDGSIGEFLLVNPTTIVALGEGGLWLLRMHVEDESFEMIQLAAHNSAPAYVLTEVTGTGVDVKQAVLQLHLKNDELRFGRLHVNDARLEVDWTKPVEDAENFFQLSKDGRSLFGVSAKEYDVLRVYDIEQKSCNTRGLAGRVPRNNDEWEVPCQAFRSVQHVYVLTFEEDIYPPYYTCDAYRCNLQEAKWEMLWADVGEVHRIVPLVNAESGEDEGFLIVRSRGFKGGYNVERYLFNTVDSLEHLAMDAFRKHNTNVKGDFNFHFFLNETMPGKKILPSMYPNMKPLDLLP